MADNFTFERPAYETRAGISLIFAIAAVTFMVGGFASPYWVESFSKSENRFVKCGLWEFCFNDYTFYKDYNGKRYIGCWYIFSNQYRPIWEWLSPPWFIVCEVLVSVCLLFHVIITFVLILLVLGVIERKMRRKEFEKGIIRDIENSVKDLKMTLMMGISFFYILIVVLGFIEMVIFGVKKEDRDWMPRPDQNFLSWGYGFFVISIIFTLISACILLSSARLVKTELDEDYPDRKYYKR